MLNAYPKGRKAAYFVSIGVAVFYAMTLLQALGWQDGNRFLTQLIVAPFAVALWSGIAFVVGAVFDIRRHRAEGSSTSRTAPHPIDVVRSSSVSESARGDPYDQAGHEVLTGDVLPNLWARALAKADLGEIAVKAEYVKLRVAQLTAADGRPIHESAALVLTGEIPYEVEADNLRTETDNGFKFTEAELAVYGFHQLDVLEEVLRHKNPDQLFAARNAIGRKIGRILGSDDERPFLEAYCRQLRVRLDDPILAPTKSAAELAGKIGEPAKGWPKWIWWPAGILLFLAYCNYSDRDQRSEPTNATAGMSYAQASAYRDCMASSRGYNLSGYAQSHICRNSALGYGGGADCRTEWDGRANATICE